MPALRKGNVIEISLFLLFTSMLVSGETRLIPTGVGPDDQFGMAVSLSADFAAVGKFLTDGADTLGAVYIFYCNEGGTNNWGQQKIVVPDDQELGDNVGLSLDISEDHLVVGASGNSNANGNNAGSAYIFNRNEGGDNNWGQVVKLIPDDGEASDAFGQAVSIAGDYAAVGAYRHGTGGAVYIFYRNEGGDDNWGQQAKIIDPGDPPVNTGFGRSVAIDGDHLLIGSGSGPAYIFYRNEGGETIWGVQQTLNNGAIISLHGNYTLVNGEIYYFENDSWNYQYSLPAGGHAAVIRDAWSTWNTPRVIIGDYSEANNTGSVYHFKKIGDTWYSYMNITAENISENDLFGWSMSVDGHNALISALGVDAVSGAAYILDLRPQIVEVGPSSAELGQTLSVSLTGRHSLFSLQEQVFIQKDGFEIYAGNVEVQWDTLLFATFSVPEEAETGWWDIYIYPGIAEVIDTVVALERFEIVEKTEPGIPGLINAFDMPPEDPSYWQFFRAPNSDPVKSFMNYSFTNDTVKIGNGAMRIDWAVHNSESGGGNVTLIHLHPNPDGLYDFSGFNTLTLWYYNTEPPVPLYRNNLNIHFYDVSNSPNGTNTYDGSQMEIYGSFHNIFVNYPGWRQIRMPLTVSPDNWNGQGFRKIEWAGIAGNEQLDLDKIKGLAFEITVSGNGEGDHTLGKFIVDHLTLENNPMITATFRCDMTYEILSGRFNPATDALSITGSMIYGGLNTNILTQSINNPNIYEIDRTMPAAAGSVIHYVFVYKKSNSTINQYEPGTNYSYFFTQTDIDNRTAGIERNFGDAQANAITEQETIVKFSVDMNSALSYLTEQPFTTIDNVGIVGKSFPLQNEWLYTKSEAVIFLNDDGTAGDLQAGDGIWSKDITFPPYTLCNIPYKYLANFGLGSNTGYNDNEAMHGLQHYITLSPNTVTTEVTNFFGEMGFHKVKNTPPTITLPSTTDTAYPGQEYSFEPVVNDLEQTGIIIKLVNSPAWLSVMDNRYIAGRPGNSGTGTFEIEILVDDLNGGITDTSYTLTVVNNLPPIPVTDLLIKDAVGENDVWFKWTAPGKNWDDGQAGSYEMRYSENPISESNFNDAVPVNPMPAPEMAGAKDSVHVTGLNAATLYYFALKSSNVDAQVSSISNIIPVITAGNGTNFPPDIITHGNSAAEIGIPYRYNENNQAVAIGTAPITWSKINGPDGFSISAQGNIQWTPLNADVNLGVLMVILQAQNLHGTDLDSIIIAFTEASKSETVTAESDEQFLDFSEASVTMSDFTNTSEMSGTITVNYMDTMPEDPDTTSAYLFGNQFWVIDATIPDYAFATTLKFTYDESKLSTFNEGELVIVYRENPGDEWIVYPEQDLDTVNNCVTLYNVTHFSIFAPADDLITTDIIIHPESVVKDFRLYPNFPNPFNPSTTIKYSIPQSGDVNLIIYNLLGQKIKTLQNSYQQPGVYRLLWDGTNEQGVTVANGIYFCLLKFNNQYLAHRMLFLK
jgi:hypothetical protein